MLQHDCGAAAASRRGGSAGVKVIAVTSGKGGVGKTHVAVNLAVALARQGRSTLLLDGDLGLANVDVLLGLRPAATLEQVVRGEAELREVLVEGPGGLAILPAASGVARLADLSLPEQHGLISAFADLPDDLEVMVVDTATGVGSLMTGFCGAAHEVILVLCDEPTSLTDAYAAVKVLSLERGVERFNVVCNRVRDGAHGRKLYGKLLEVCDRFLDVSLSYLGSVPEDDALRSAVRSRKAVVERFPQSPAGLAFKELAARADRWVVPRSAASRPVFFLERILAGWAAADDKAVG